MPQVQRSSDIVEMHSEKALSFAFGGIISLAIGGLLFAYRGSGMFVPLGTVLAIIGTSCLSYAGYCLLQVRKVTSVAVFCPYCSAKNGVLSTPNDDFTCIDCHRLIPIRDGQPLTVQQVRCGFCNELNYYSEKTDVLLCETCNHEIPITHEEGYVSKKRLPSAYAVTEDEGLYDLVLVSHGHKTEELIGALQHLLALNRNQVKQILTETPVTLMSGIPRRKAESVKTQLNRFEALVEFKSVSNQPVDSRL